MSLATSNMTGSQISWILKQTLIPMNILDESKKKLSKNLLKVALKLINLKHVNSEKILCHVNVNKGTS